VVVGVLDIRLTVRGSRSLKDKRRVVRSVKNRLRNRFNVSVAEVGALDMHQSAELAIVQASDDSRYVRGALEQVVSFLRRDREAEVCDYRIDVLYP